MKDLKPKNIELVFENCDGIMIPSDLIELSIYDTKQRYSWYPKGNGGTGSVLAGKVVTDLSIAINYDKLLELNPKTVNGDELKRIYTYRDITQIYINYEDSKEEPLGFYVSWDHSGSEYENSFQKNFVEYNEDTRENILIIEIKETN